MPNCQRCVFVTHCLVHLFCIPFVPWLLDSWLDWALTEHWLDSWRDFWHEEVETLQTLLSDVCVCIVWGRRFAAWSSVKKRLTAVVQEVLVLSALQTLFLTFLFSTKNIVCFKLQKKVQKATQKQTKQIKKERKQRKQYIQVKILQILKQKTVRELFQWVFPPQLWSSLVMPSDDDTPTPTTLRQAFGGKLWYVQTFRWNVRNLVGSSFDSTSRRWKVMSFDGLPKLARLSPPEHVEPLGFKALLKF